MSKGRLLIIWLIVVVFCGVITGCDNTDRTPVAMGQLDSLKLLTLDSTQFQLTKSDMREALLAVVYNPWCEHCQMEAEEFHYNMKKLENVTILMIGSESMKDMSSFSEKYGLKNFKNVKFIYASPVATYNILGAYHLPHMRLYDKSLKPIRDFTSTTSVDTIVSYLKK